MGLRPLFYRPAARDDGLYRMAWSLVVALSAFAVAVAALAAIRLLTPASAESFAGGMVPLLAACVVLGLGAEATRIATRRRERMAGVKQVGDEMEGAGG